jgi:hypothetical protein
MDEPQDRLPAGLVRALGDKALDPPDQPAFLLVTTDEDGAPRVSMLSVGELLVHDERTLRVALWPRTRTAGNLGRGGTALLTAVSPGSVIHVWTRSSRLVVPEDAGLECFELTATDVRVDLHAGMPVTSGITFRPDDPGQAVASWRRQRALLAEARPE